MAIGNLDTFVTNNAGQTRKLGELMAGELRGGPACNASRSDAGGEIVCLTGELGSGKTTFAQGVLKGLGTKGPYTSPTFVILKRYKVKSQKPARNASHIEAGGSKVKITSKNSKVIGVYHFDVYRIGPKDILDLGWEEIIADKKNIIIIEWAERIKSIIPKGAVWVKFEHVDKSKRRIVIGNIVIGGGIGHWSLVMRKKPKTNDSQPDQLPTALLPKT